MTGGGTTTEPAGPDTLSGRMRTYLAEQAEPWVSIEVSKLRAEAADQRRRRKAAEVEAESERESAGRRVAELKHAVEELRAALRSAEGRAHGLPREVLPRIVGDTPALIAADAASWAIALGLKR